MATDIERVRQKIGDRRKIQRKEATGDGTSKFFKLDHEPVDSVDVDIWINDVITTNYTVDEDNGVIEFISAPVANAKITFQYYAVIWTDTEIQDHLDQYSDNILITSAHILLSWAADVARLAKRETRSGGGGLGAITVDTSVAARELRNTAKALMDWELEYGTADGASIPADGLTEIPWTEAGYQETAYQKLLRES